MSLQLYSSISQLDPHIKLILFNAIDSIQKKHDALLHQYNLLKKQNKDLLDLMIKKDMRETDQRENIPI